MTIKPHDVFSYMRPDEVAECWEGIDDELYIVLWGMMKGMKPIGEQIDIEDSGPTDAIGLNTVASVWGDFTEVEQEMLNALAVEEDK